MFLSSRPASLYTTHATSRPVQRYNEPRFSWKVKLMAVLVVVLCATIPYMAEQLAQLVR